MASAGSSFDFASNAVICSSDDATNHQLSNARRSDLFDEMGLPDNGVEKKLVSVYSPQQNQYPKDEITDVIKKRIEKYTDHFIQHFEGTSGRLSQLEIQFYKLERKISEFHADSIGDQGEADAKLKTVAKHLKEVHRCIEIIRDKHELAETQRELTKHQAKQHNVINQSIPVFHQQFQSSPPEPQYIQTQHRSFVIPKLNYYAQSNPQFLYPPQPYCTLYQSQTQPVGNDSPNPFSQFLIIQTQSPPMNASGSISSGYQSQLYSIIEGSNVQTFVHQNNVPCMRNHSSFTDV